MPFSMEEINALRKNFRVKNSPKLYGEEIRVVRRERSPKKNKKKRSSHYSLAYVVVVHAKTFEQLLEKPLAATATVVLHQYIVNYKVFRFTSQ